MDLSRLKWPIIIIVVVFGVWLLSDGGVNWMFGRFTSAEPGLDEGRDRSDEAGLTTLAGYLMRTYRFGKARNTLELTLDRYPAGKNYWLNKYRLVKCYEKTGDYRAAVDTLKYLMANEAWLNDDRVPEYENLRLRAEKHIEMYQLERR